ncbi:MAG TPA: hypothetical protein PLF21_07660 [Exilispira sp.]|nr:hypothetical protein [Exilispira sp.]
MAYRNCCIEKLYKNIYEHKNEKYNYLRCTCRETYYLLPYKFDNINITIIREKDEDIYYFLDKDKELHPLFKLTDFDINDKENIKNIIKNKVLAILNENSEN